MGWIKERLMNGLFYVTITLAIGFALYSAFLKPTTKTTNTAEKIYQTNEDIKVNFGGCAHFSGKRNEK